MKKWTWFSKKMLFFNSIYMTGTIASIYRTFIISDWFCFIYLIFKLFDSRRQISAWSWSQFSDFNLDIFKSCQNLKFKWFATQSDFKSTPLGEFRRRCRVTRWCSISDSDSELVELELEDDDELEEELELDMSKQKYHFRSDFPNEDSVVKWTAYWTGLWRRSRTERKDLKSTWAW